MSFPKTIMIKDKRFMNKMTKMILVSTTALTATIAPVQSQAQELPTLSQVDIDDHVDKAKSQAEQALINFVGNGQEINVSTTTIAHNNNSITIPVTVSQDVHNTINDKTPETGISIQEDVYTYGIQPVEQGNDRVLNKSLQPGEERVVSQGRPGIEYQIGKNDSQQVVAPQNSVTEYNHKPKPAPKPTVASENIGGVWHSLAQCESGGNWSINTGLYDGGLQFHPQTWNAYGGQQYAPRAYMATSEQQVAVAERVLASQGWGAWPACSAKLGLR